MPTNYINAQFSAKESEDVKAILATLSEKLPFLINLSPDERAGMPRFGDKSRAFIIKALSIAHDHPEILPSSFSLNEFIADAEVMENLYSISKGIEILLGKVNDTEYAAGSEAYAAALLVYQYAKIHNVATGALEDILDDLGRRFVRKTNTTTHPAA